MKGLTISNNYFEANNRKQIYLQPRPYTLKPWPTGGQNLTIEADIVLNGAYPPNGAPLYSFARSCASTGVTISGNTFAPVQPNASAVLLVAAVGVSITQNVLLGATSIKPEAQMAVAATGNAASHWLTRDVWLSGNAGWNYKRGPVRVLDGADGLVDHRVGLHTFSAPDVVEQYLNFAEVCCQWVPIEDLGAVLPMMTTSDMIDGRPVQRWIVPAGHTSAAAQAVNVSLETTPALAGKQVYFAVKVLHVNYTQPLVLLIDPGDGKWERSGPSKQTDNRPRGAQPKWEVISFAVTLHTTGIARFGLELSTGGELLVMTSHSRSPATQHGRGSAVVVTAVGASWNQVLKTDDGNSGSGRTDSILCGDSCSQLQAKTDDDELYVSATHGGALEVSFRGAKYEISTAISSPGASLSQWNELNGTVQQKSQRWTVGVNPSPISTSSWKTSTSSTRARNT